MATPENDSEFIPIRSSDSKLVAFGLTSPESEDELFTPILSPDGILVAKRVILAEDLDDEAFPVLTSDGKLVLVKEVGGGVPRSFRNSWLKIDQISGFGDDITLLATAVTEAQADHDANDWDTGPTTSNFREIQDFNQDPDDRDWRVNVATLQFRSVWNTNSSYNASDFFDFYRDSPWQAALDKGIFLRVLLANSTATAAVTKFNYNFQLFMEVTFDWELGIDNGAEAITVLGSPTATGIGVDLGQEWKSLGVRAGFVDFDIPASFFTSVPEAGKASNMGFLLRFYIRIDRNDSFDEPVDPKFSHRIDLQGLAVVPRDPGDVLAFGRQLADDTFIYAGVYI